MGQCSQSSLSTYMGNLKSAYEEHNITLVVCGMEAYYRYIRMSCILRSCQISSVYEFKLLISSGTTRLGKIVSFESKYEAAIHHLPPKKHFLMYQ